MTQVNNGKSFEFALASQISKATGVRITANKASDTAEKYYTNNPKRHHMDVVASEVAIFLHCHDERLDSTTGITLQDDFKGRGGDVRDIVIKITGTEIGISAKHNHHAVKHSRLSSKIDFGKEWGGYPVSSMYWKAVNPIFEDMQEKRDKGTLFRQIKNKHAVYYLPILTAFEDELKLLCEDFSKQFIKPFFQYLLGREDYYKVICQPKKVYIQSTNINGTLKWGGKWKIPERIEQIRRRENSKSTILVSFSGGWQLSFRIHNARSLIEPSLKFDIQFVGLPQNVARHEIPLSS